jgi:hypothetical protein
MIYLQIKRGQRRSQKFAKRSKEAPKEKNLGRDE